MKRIYYLIIVIIFNSAALNAFHIVGGDLTYKYISSNTFEFKLVLFRDCYSTGANFDPTITVGFFDKVTNVKFQDYTVSLTGSGPVVPSGIDCAPPPDVCVEEGWYIWTVTLPDNPNGYYAVWERCCRNIIVTNLLDPQSTGIVLYVEIADPALQNSSPEFINPPLPYACEENPFEYNFTAFDADGDLLVYSLQTPLAGNTGQVGNMPVLPSPLPGPFDSAVWQPGFNLANIAGGNPITINSQTGLVEGSPGMIGMYAMAVSVKEYRNGIKIGEVRREIEFIALLCEQNSAPAVTDTLQVLANHITVYPDDSLCFSLIVSDADADSLFLTHSGNVFSLANPAVTQDAVGDSVIFTFFCWIPRCNDVNSNSYQATFTVKDNGCPLPKTTVHTYNITVTEPPHIPPANLLCLEYVGNDELVVHFNDTMGNYSDFFTNYNVYRSVDGGSFLLHDIITDTTALTWTDANAPQNQTLDYCYFFTGVNICGAESIPSDTVCSLSNANGTINYLTYVTVAGENEIELKWEPNYDNLFSEFYIERSDNEFFSSYSNIATFSGPAFTTWKDRSAQTGDQSYCYRIITKNVCNNFSQPSNEACSIYLSGESELFKHSLKWTPYRTWQSGVADYKILRSVPGNELFEEVGAAPETHQLYIDDHLNLREGEFVYKIKAMEGIGGLGAESYSNEIVLEQKPHLYIPNAFTPNNDGSNESWGAGSAFVKEMELIIFNRLGQIVFTTTDTDKHWDGNIDGKKAPEGVYAYSLTYKGFDNNRTFIKKGYFTLVR